MGDIGSDFAVTYQLAVVTPISADASLTETNLDFGPGNRARMPDFEGRLAAKYVAEKKTLFELGLSGHIGKERFGITGASKEDSEASSKILAADLQINLPYVALRGEAFRGFNADTAWGALGSGVIFNRGPASGTTPGPVLSVRDEVRSSGGWGQLILTPIPQIQIFGGGGIERVDQNQWALLGTGRTQNGRITAGIIAALTKRWSASFEWTETHTHTATQKFKSSQFAIANQLEF
jgi:hypothetical protein